MALSNYARDTFVAPHLSKLTTMGAPDIQDLARPWVNNFIVTTIVKLGKEYRHRQLILHTLRKIEGAFQEYQEARDILQGYVKTRTDISCYFHALRHFETATLLAYHAYETIGTMISERLFSQEDGSPLQRINRLQNISKHAHEFFNRGNFPKSLSIPIWLTNMGLECHDKTALAFSEFAELMADLARLADIISNPKLAKVERRT